MALCLWRCASSYKAGAVPDGGFEFDTAPLVWLLEGEKWSRSFEVHRELKPAKGLSSFS